MSASFGFKKRPTYTGQYVQDFSPQNSPRGGPGCPRYKDGACGRCHQGATAFWCCDCGLRYCTTCDALIHTGELSGHNRKPSGGGPQQEMRYTGEEPPLCDTCRKVPSDVWCAACESYFCRGCSDATHVGALSGHLLTSTRGGHASSIRQGKYGAPYGAGRADGGMSQGHGHGSLGGHGARGLASAPSNSLLDAAMRRHNDPNFKHSGEQRMCGVCGHARAEVWCADCGLPFCEPCGVGAHVGPLKNHNMKQMSEVSTELYAKLSPRFVGRQTTPRLAPPAPFTRARQDSPLRSASHNYHNLKDGSADLRELGLDASPTKHSPQFGGGEKPAGDTCDRCAAEPATLRCGECGFRMCKHCDGIIHVGGLSAHTVTTLAGTAQGRPSAGGGGASPSTSTSGNIPVHRQISSPSSAQGSPGAGRTSSPSFTRVGQPSPNGGGGSPRRGSGGGGGEGALVDPGRESLLLPREHSPRADGSEVCVKCKNKATYWCADCKLVQCHQCVMNHHVGCSKRGHVLLPLAFMAAHRGKDRVDLLPDERCGKCNGNRATWYCNECRLNFCHGCSALAHRDPGTEHHDCVMMASKRHEQIHNAFERKHAGTGYKPASLTPRAPPGQMHPSTPREHVRRR